jgi:LacI family transcriptional regulator
MPATIYDIARVAGVSSSTVARVLRGDTKEGRKDSAERAERIRRIARQLGYRPNLRARAFSEGRTRSVGLLFSDDAWVFHGVNDKVVQGLVQELRKERHHLVLAPLDEHGDWEQVVLGGYVDGCVTFQPLSPVVRRALAGADLPCVLLGDNSDPELPHIVVDDHGGAYAATRHLISLGHQRIALFVHAEVKPHCSIDERRRGYEAAMREHSLTPQFWHVSEAEAIEQLLRERERPTGLICYSDLESTLIANAMWHYGVQIPRDLSLVGFNDKFATEYMTPPLTTVGFDAHRIGVLGAQMILSHLGDEGESSDAARSQRIMTRLIVRGSTAPPAGALPRPANGAHIHDHSHRLGNGQS